MFVILMVFTNYKIGLNKIKKTMVSLDIRIKMTKI